MGHATKLYIQRQLATVRQAAKAVQCFSMFKMARVDPYGKRLVGEGWMQMAFVFHPGFVFALACLGWAMLPALAQGTSDAPAREFKLTPSAYVNDGGMRATDVNLRWRQGAHATWLGHYSNSDQFAQTRAGYEYAWQTQWGQWVPSLQVASMGFAGGSLNWQSPGTVFGLLGWGRTNGRDYYNLNFDPNDSVLIGGGFKWREQHVFNLLNVSDNRFDTGQSVTHANWRYSPRNHQSLVLDLAVKQGRPAANEPEVRGQIVSLVFNHGPVFVHWAQDRKVNFSDDSQTRMALGLRF